MCARIHQRLVSTHNTDTTDKVGPSLFWKDIPETKPWLALQKGTFATGTARKESSNALFSYCFPFPRVLCIIQPSTKD